METLQELAEVLAEIESLRRSARLAALRDVANPFNQVRATSGEVSAKALATAIVVSRDIDDVWAVLRFHRSMGGEDLTGYLCGSPIFAPWIQGEPGLEVVDFDGLKARAEAWLSPQN